ncbi:Innexin inx2 [Armadillidium vulgare]|nr:Innexin inx2 [Armadillidium vulgare]
MYDIISSILGILKVNPITIDNNAFLLHYKVTMFILITFSLLVTQKQYFGDPIDCEADSAIDLLDTYCWIQSTFTVYQSTSSGKNQSFPQAHALMFYIPHYLWKIWEGGKLRKLIEGMHLYIIDEEELKKKSNFLISYFKLNFNKQELYAYRFFFCEFLNFANVILQIVLTD